MALCKSHKSHFTISCNTLWCCLTILKQLFCDSDFYFETTSTTFPCKCFQSSSAVSLYLCKCICWASLAMNPLTFNDAAFTREMQNSWRLTKVDAFVYTCSWLGFHARCISVYYNMRFWSGHWWSRFCLVNECSVTKTLKVLWVTVA